jgi:hypothetical protein
MMAGREGVGVKIGGRRRGGDKLGGHDGFAADVAGAADTAGFAAGCDRPADLSGAFGAGPEISPVG